MVPEACAAVGALGWAPPLAGAVNEVRDLLRDDRATREPVIGLRCARRVAPALWRAGRLTSSSRSLESFPLGSAHDSRGLSLGLLVAGCRRAVGLRVGRNSQPRSREARPLDLRC